VFLGADLIICFYVCLPICLSICLTICLFICHVYLPIRLSVHFPCLSARLSLCQFVCPSANLPSAHLSVCVFFVHLPICLSINLSVSLSIYPPVWLFFISSCPSVCLSVPVSLHLSVWIYICLTMLLSVYTAVFIFVPFRPFQPSLMFMSKARAYPGEAPFKCSFMVKAPS
jgi:hypothetical protein